jgi:hypothetical protein
LSLELLPTATQSMTAKDSVQLVEIEDAGFDKLKDAGFVFGTTGIECDGHDVLGGKDARRCSVHILFHGSGQRFSQKRAPSRKKLDRPARNDDVLTRDLPIAWSRHYATYTVYPAASPHAVFTFHQSAGLGVEFNENIDVQRGNRFEIKCCADSAANGVTVDDAIALHLVDHLDGLSDAHGRELSLKRL